MVRLGDVAEVHSSLVQPGAIEGNIIYLGLENLEKGGGIKSTPIALTANIKSAKRMFDGQDILFGRLRPNLQKVALPWFSGVCTTDILTIRPINRTDRNYLYHYLLTPQVLEYVSTRTTGINLPRISPAQLLELSVPLPPLDEQRRIAGILDKVSTLLDATHRTQRVIATARENAVEDLLARYSGDSVPLGELSEIRSGITKGRRVPVGTPLSAAPYLAVSNVKDGFLDLTEVKKIETTKEEQSKFALQEGDLLLTEGGDPDKLGRGTVWKGEIEGCLHQNHIFRVRLHSGVNYTPKTLMSIVSSRHLKAYFLRSAKQTTGIASINRTQLSSAPIPALSSLQIHELESILTNFIALQSEMNSRSNLLQTLRDCLQTRAFQGTL